MPASESAVHVDRGTAIRTGHVANPASDANEKQNPVRHRVFKTVCLYVSFGTMVRQFEDVTFREYLYEPYSHSSCSIQQSSCYTCYTCYTEDNGLADKTSTEPGLLSLTRNALPVHVPAMLSLVTLPNYQWIHGLIGLSCVIFSCCVF